MRAPPRWPAADAQVVMIFRELKITTETTSASTSQFACGLTRNPWAMNAGTSCRRGFKLIPIDPAQRDLFHYLGSEAGKPGLGARATSHSGASRWTALNRVLCTAAWSGILTIAPFVAAARRPEGFAARSLTCRPGYASSLAPRERAWDPQQNVNLISARALSHNCSLHAIHF